MSKFDDCIQPGDKVIFNEDLGCRVNISQLNRVAKKEECPQMELYNKAIRDDIIRMVAHLARVHHVKQNKIELEMFEYTRNKYCVAGGGSHEV